MHQRIGFLKRPLLDYTSDGITQTAKWGGPRKDQMHNDSLRAVIRMPDNPRLQFLLDVATMADGMKAKVSPRV